MWKAKLEQAARDRLFQHGRHAHATFPPFHFSIAYPWWWPFVHCPKRFSKRRDGLSRIARIARVDQQRGWRPTRGLRTPV